ncbi:hypothetical protein [Crocosphaera sp.]|uniref:hypothetical protein n=1 Tax=Crocosphaera sp. TaxID=2729996 RepID=UPI0026344901|nr:hypothetical protein [Crocosphaera sp.]
MSSPKNLPKQASDSTFKLEQQIFKQEDKGDGKKSSVSSPTRSIAVAKAIRTFFCSLFPVPCSLKI